MCAKVIHLGCGALGLGLTIPLLKDLPNSKFYLSNRRNYNQVENLKNELLKTKRSYDLKIGSISKEIDISDFFYFDEVDKLKEIVRTDQVIYITTALKETGIDANIELIADLIRERSRIYTEYPLLFIACENALSSKSIAEKVKSEIHKENPTFKNRNEIWFIDSVVDRMCNYPVILGNKLVVEVEPYCSWIINASDINLGIFNQRKYLLKSFEKLSNDVTFVNDIDFYVRRKKWIVNSLHQLIALYAHDANYFLIDFFVNSKETENIIEAICIDTYRRYMAIEPNADKTETMAYIDQFILRLTEYPSKVTSALTRFKSDKLQEFYTDFHRKTGHPASHYYTVTSDFLTSVNFILLQVVNMIKEGKFIR